MLYCPQCGAPTKATWRFCRYCGGEFEEVTVESGQSEKSERAREGVELVAPPDRPPAMAFPESTPASRQCPHCQTTLRRQARFCDVCGAAVDVRTTPTPTRSTAGLSETDMPPTGRAASLPAEMQDLTLGGYAGTTSQEVAELTPEERNIFKRILIGLLMVVALILGFLLIRAWVGSQSKMDQAAVESPSQAGASAPTVSPEFLPVSFSVGAIEKEDRFAGGHPHALVRIDDQALFIIRDEGPYPSTIERAQAIADNLRQAIANLKRDPEALFRWEPRPQGPTIVQIAPNLVGESKLTIVTILKPDVAGYNLRSHRKITAEQLAQWWLDRLEDRVNVFVKGKRPTLTTDDEDGRILMELYERARSRSPQAALTVDALYEALRELGPEQRRLLSYEGVRKIPHHGEH